MNRDIWYVCYEENPFRVKCIGEFASALEADIFFRKKKIETRKSALLSISSLVFPGLREILLEKKFNNSTKFVHTKHHSS